MEKEMHSRLKPDGHGRQDRADIDLVAPLASATVKRIEDTWSVYSERSCAITQLSDRPGDVDSANHRSTPATTATPGRRTSTTATRIGTTRTTTFEPARFADESPNHADFSFADLVAAYFDCRQNKRNKKSALAFELNLERNLGRLYDQLQDGTYTPGPSICFIITRPKPREVWAADFRDRIAHHLLYNKIAPRFHASFIADSCACIPGRGTLYGAVRLEAKVRSITQNWKQAAFYLKADIQNFFVSIDKRILFDLVAAKVPEPWWRNLAAQILFHDPRVDVVIQSSPGKMALIPPHKSLFNQSEYRGLPIGNLSSQFFANILMNELDQFIKHQVVAKHYIRYVDDFILLHESPQWLNAAKAQIESFLPQLALQLNPKKTILQPVDRGIDFVGQVIKPWRRTVRRRTFNDSLYQVQQIPDPDLFESINSYFGLMRQASHSQRDRVLLARLVRRHGFSVDQKLTKVFKRVRPANVSGAGRTAQFVAL
jgi:RNA-directed DNA polymerase